MMRFNVEKGYYENIEESKNVAPVADVLETAPPVNSLITEDPEDEPFEEPSIVSKKNKLKK
jgi:hypothetical protein